MKKTKLIVAVLMLACISIPANAGTWENLKNLATKLYRYYNNVEVYTLCPGNGTVVTLQPEPIGDQWSCAGRTFPTSALAVCGDCPGGGQGCNFEGPIGACCVMQDCE